MGGRLGGTATRGATAHKGQLGPDSHAPPAGEWVRHHHPNSLKQTPHSVASAPAANSVPQFMQRLTTPECSPDAIREAAMDTGTGGIAETGDGPGSAEFRSCADAEVLLPLKMCFLEPPSGAFSASPELPVPVAWKSGTVSNREPDSDASAGSSFLFFR